MFVLDDPFWALVDVKGPDDCWEKHTDVDKKTGYARYRPKFKGPSYVASRYAAYLAGIVKTPWAPKNKKGNDFALHNCNNRKCCNPKHLYSGTYRQNLIDAYRMQHRVATPRNKKGQFDASSRVGL